MNGRGKMFLISKRKIKKKKNYKKRVRALRLKKGRLDTDKKEDMARNSRKGNFPIPTLEMRK